MLKKKKKKLYFRDIGSSSGTFLNKLRLSPSGKESRPYLLRSGDVIQLGIDYHGKKEGNKILKKKKKKKK